MDERKLNVHNFFLINHIMDDKESQEELVLIGTMVQHVFRGKDYPMDENVFTAKNLDDALGYSSNHSVDLKSLDSYLPNNNKDDETPMSEWKIVTFSIEQTWFIWFTGWQTDVHSTPFIKYSDYQSLQLSITPIINLFFMFKML